MISPLSIIIIKCNHAASLNRNYFYIYGMLHYSSKENKFAVFRRRRRLLGGAAA